MTELEVDDLPDDVRESVDEVALLLADAQNYLLAEDPSAAASALSDLQTAAERAENAIDSEYAIQDGDRT